MDQGNPTEYLAFSGLGMSVTTLSRQVRSFLAESADALPLEEILLTVDSFVLECSSSDEQDALLHSLENDLQEIHHDLVDHSSFDQTVTFLTVLHHLRPVLPSTSIISTWFDLVLRPALREPKLPTRAVNHAKGLIVCALETSQNQEKVGEFRRRLLDLYLLDALNEGSEDDILEWADLNQQQRHTRMHWKSNLEDVLVKFGLEKPTVSFASCPSILSDFEPPLYTGLSDRNQRVFLNPFLATSTVHADERVHLSRVFPFLRSSARQTSSDGKSSKISSPGQLLYDVHNRAHSPGQSSSYLRGPCMRKSQTFTCPIPRSAHSHYLLERATTLSPQGLCFFAA